MKNFFKEEEIEMPLNLGKVRSGSKVLDINVKVNAAEVSPYLTHEYIPSSHLNFNSTLKKTFIFQTYNFAW